MTSFWRKFLSNNSDQSAVSQSGLQRGKDHQPEVYSVGAFLQQKFSRGVNYNVKIVIRGDRNVGKTALFCRLKGQPFVEDYVPSTEIQVASIHWNYNNTNEVIKVEVWDVVDRGKPRIATKGLKLHNNATNNNSLPNDLEDPCLDATFLDVYKGAHGVIFVMDMTKSWSFDYVSRELPKVPAHIPVLVLANRRDMGHHRTITEDQVREFLKDEASPATMESSQHTNTAVSSKRAVPVQYCEASMQNGFGLVYVHKFHGLPFLRLQLDVLERQIDRNRLDMTKLLAELGVGGSDEEDNESQSKAWNNEVTYKA